MGSSSRRCMSSPLCSRLYDVVYSNLGVALSEVCLWRHGSISLREIKARLRCVKSRWSLRMMAFDTRLQVSILSLVSPFWISKPHLDICSAPPIQRLHSRRSDQPFLNGPRLIRQVEMLLRSPMELRWCF